MNYSSGLSSSSLGMLTRISESENDNYGVSTGAYGADNLGNENIDVDHYGHSYPFGAWNDSPCFEENISGLIKTEVDDGMKSFGDLQSTEVINRPLVLSHNMSLPKTSAEMDAGEKVLQFQDTIPCKIRAKRGCATHPRSIAERVIDEYDQDVHYVEIVITEDPEIAEAAGIMGTPCVQFFKNKEILGTVAGVKMKKEYRGVIEANK